MEGCSITSTQVKVTAPRRESKPLACYLGPVPTCEQTNLLNMSAADCGEDPSALIVIFFNHNPESNLGKSKIANGG